MLANSLYSTRGVVILAGSVFFVLALAGLTFSHLDSQKFPIRPLKSCSADLLELVDNNNVSYPTPSTNTDRIIRDEQLREFFLNEMHKPRMAPNQSVFKPYDASEWTLYGKAHWQQPMGQNLCIIDLDDRDFDEPGEIYGPRVMSWDSPAGVHGLSLGLLNHYVYARIHGYKYYYVKTVDPLDRRASWKKPSIISKILKEHDVCIFLDSDAIFTNLDLPFEWLMNYWKLNPDFNSMALAVDPEEDYNKDRYGNLYLNTGFIISQNNPTTFEILQDWEKCPEDDGPYPGCDRFRHRENGEPSDQGGFGTFVRYSYADSIQALPCTEANGFPQAGAACEGIFVRHLWIGKDDQLKIDVGQQLPGPFLKLFHEQYLRDKPTFYMDEADLLSLGASAALSGKIPHDEPRFDISPDAMAPNEPSHPAPQGVNADPLAHDDAERFTSNYHPS